MLEKDSDTDQLGWKMGLFGVPFDPLPSKEALVIKHGLMRALALGNIAQDNYGDTYDFFSGNLPEVISRKCHLLGKVSIPTWLQPKPQPNDASNLTLNLLNDFIKSGGCLTIANKVRDFVIRNILPGIPGMIGVDHSSTYGAISALAEYKEEKLGLIVLDSHFDAVPIDLRYGIMEYAREADLPSIAPDLFSQGFLPSHSKHEIREWVELDAENFILHILEDKLVDPENLVLIGIVDYPGRAFEESDDPRLRDYVNFFKSLERAGTQFISNSSLDEYGTEPLEKALKKLNTKQVYISLDIDIGSLSSVYACRFLNTIGLSFSQIRDVFQSLFSFFSNGLTLAGFDLMEVDIHKLGVKIDSLHVDQTSKITRLFLESVGKVI